MTKAILVIDMPKSCVSCPIACETEDWQFHCPLTYEEISRVEKSYKSNDCPLKEMPKKKDDTQTKFMDSTEYARGFNDCIDGILGEE